MYMRSGRDWRCGLELQFPRTSFGNFPYMCMLSFIVSSFVLQSPSYQSLIAAPRIFKHREVGHGEKIPVCEGDGGDGPVEKHNTISQGVQRGPRERYGSLRQRSNPDASVISDPGRQTRGVHCHNVFLNRNAAYFRVLRTLKKASLLCLYLSQHGESMPSKPLSRSHPVLLTRPWMSAKIGG